MGQTHPQNPLTLAPFLLSQACCYPFSVTSLSYLGSQAKGPFPFHGVGPQKGEGEVCMISSRNRVTSWSPHFWTPVTAQNLSGSGPCTAGNEQMILFHTWLLPQLFGGNPYCTLSLMWEATFSENFPDSPRRTTSPQLSWNTGPSSHKALPNTNFLLQVCQSCAQLWAP